MCDPMSAGMAAVSLVGAKMQSDAQNDAINRQQKAINSALEQQDQYSRQAEGKALVNAQNYDMGKRLQSFDTAREEAGKSLAQQLTQTRETSPNPSQAAGRMSQEFLSGSAKAAADQFEKSINMAQLMGRMRGASDMVTQEGYRNADYASQLGQIGRNAQGAARSSEIGIKNAGRVNGGQVALGSGLSHIGTSYLSSSLGKALGNMFEPSITAGYEGTWTSEGPFDPKTYAKQIWD